MRAVTFSPVLIKNEVLVAVRFDAKRTTIPAYVSMDEKVKYDEDKTKTPSPPSLELATTRIHSRLGAWRNSVPAGVKTRSVRA